MNHYYYCILIRERILGGNALIPSTHPPPFFPQVIERANDVPYGLSACVWSENSGMTHRVAQALDVRIKHFFILYIYIYGGGCYECILWVAQ